MFNVWGLQFFRYVIHNHLSWKSQLSKQHHDHKTKKVQSFYSFRLEMITQQKFSKIDFFGFVSSSLNHVKCKIEKNGHTLKSCDVYTTRFFTYVWQFLNIIHERLNPTAIAGSLSPTNFLWKIAPPLESRHKCIQRDFEAGVPVWAPKLGAQKSFLVQYILSSIHK